MAGYEKQTWTDKISDVTAERMNHIEKGIEEAGKTGGVETGSVIGWTGAEIPEGYEEVDSSLLPANDGVPTGTIVEWEEDEIPEGYEEVEDDKIDVSLVQNQMITVTNAENQTTATQIEQVKFNSVFGKVGEQLSLSNYNVVIGKGISLIKVSGCLGTVYNSITDVLTLRLFKNGTEILIMGNGKSSSGFSAQAILPSVILPVKEGDTIAFKVGGNNSGIALQAKRCLLTVEAVG